MKPTHVEIVDEKAPGGRRTIKAANFNPGRRVKGVLRPDVLYVPPAGEEEESFDEETGGGEGEEEGAGEGEGEKKEEPAEKPKKKRGARA